ncbi:MAG: electron transport complex subunit RsxG [Gallionella sp.]|nr:electron transport complex subunit RsxG [Gallionella sp.]
MRRTTAKASLYTALNLLFFALAGTALLALTYDLTHDTIARSEDLEKLKLIAQIVPPAAYDNDIMKDTAQLAADEMLGSDEPAIVYRGRLNNQPSVAVIQAVALGYSGKTSLIIAITRDGRISGVRVLSHKETPGLGDYIEIAKSNWITGFNGASLENPRESEWKVKKDGGKFDYMAGATITPRSIVKAVHKALQYYALHREELFANEGARRAVPLPP